MNERKLSSRAENFLKHGLPATLALGGVAAFGVSHAVSTLEKESLECSPAIEQVTVQQGDTLWDIARTHAPDADPRDTMHEIALNNPEAIDIAGDIHPGSSLSIEVCLPDNKNK